MADPEAKSPERESLEALLRILLPEAMVADAAELARTAAQAARKAAARLPFDARDPTGFLDVLESLGPSVAKDD